MDSLLGPTFAVLDSSLRFRVSRGAMLASNVANADTPGYRARDLHFDQLLNERLGVLRRTHAGHLPTASAGSGSYRVETGPRGTRPDGNGVDLDQQVLKAHRNAGAFSEQAAVLGRLTGMIRTAMGGGR